MISWIKSVADTKMQGYQLLMKEFGKNQTQAENLAKNVGNALIKLEMEDGIERPIADRLWRKFGERIHLWRMTSKDYQKSCSNERITDVRLVKLDRVKNPVLRETAKRVKGKRVSAYQENILDDLLKDIGDKAVG